MFEIRGLDERRVTHADGGILGITRYYLVIAAGLTLPILPTGVINAQVARPSEEKPPNTVDDRVEGLLGRLSLEDKLDLIGGSEGTYIRAEPKIGLPRMRLSDGPVGAHPDGPSTAYPAGIALAAAWDPDLALRVGQAMGSDARARGVYFLLGPGVNIYRAPMNGRNFEYFGEDPYLAARTVVGYVEGVQSEGVVATVKHFALNNQEWDRHNVSSDADERTMREIYFPAFEAAVREAHAGAVMNSYNLINGIHATQNAWLNNQVLKKDWGFDGILMSDWAATYDGVAAANAGLDLEMPNPDFMNRKTLLPAIQSGAVPTEVIDDKVRRILRVAVRFGFLDRPQQDLSIPLYNPGAKAVALDEARESTVLLKNERKLLPLDPARVLTIALIGPTAWLADTGGGGSSFVPPLATESILAGLSKVSNLKVLYAPGLTTAENLYEQTSYDERPKVGDRQPDRIKIETFANRGLSGPPVSVNYIGSLATWRPDVWSPAVHLEKSIRYPASFTAMKDGAHIVAVAGTASDGYRLLIDGKEVLKQVSRESQAPQSTQIALHKGVPVSVVLEYLPGADEPRISLGIRAVADLISPEAKKIAALSDLALVAVGYDTSLESEGFDRTYTLPFGQDALIDAVEQANQKTIVAPPAAPGATPHVRYEEGVFLGYRYYQTVGKKPLYPFGFGLTYSEFTFTNLNVSPPSGLATGFRVSFDVANSGQRSGADVAQLYVGDPSATVKGPAKELKGFQKVRLEPGQSQHVEMTLDRRALSYWDEKSHDSKVDPGKFIVYVGDSSENTPLSANFTVTAQER